jgi:PTS system galactitol-specific IIC component
MTMDALFELASAFNTLLNQAGQAVWLPVFLFIIAMIMGAKFGSAFRNAITLGVGWIGLQVVLGLFFEALVPPTTAMIANTGVSLTAIDVGWPPMAAIAFASTVGVLMIPIGLVVNLVLLALNLTKTLDIDIWNFWHWAFVGGTIMQFTGDFMFAILSAVAYEIMCLKVGDWTVKPLWDLFPGYKGYSLPHGGGWVGAIHIIAIFKPIVDMIPTPKTDPKTVRKRLGVLGEPIIMGLILGIVIGALAGYDSLDIAKLAMNSAAVMLLLPRMIGIIMEGLTGISDIAQSFIKTRFPGREIYIGLDAAVAIGDATNVTVALIMIPFVLLFAIVTPFITVMPYADLASTPFFSVACTPFMHADLIKSLILSLIVMFYWQVVGSWWSPIMTDLAKTVGAIAPDAEPIGSLWLQAMIPLAWLAAQFPIAVGYVLMAVVALIFLFADRSKTLVDLFSKLYP